MAEAGEEGGVMVERAQYRMLYRDTLSGHTEWTESAPDVRSAVRSAGAEGLCVEVEYRTVVESEPRGPLPLDGQRWKVEPSFHYEYRAVGARGSASGWNLTVGKALTAAGFESDAVAYVERRLVGPPERLPEDAS